MTQKVKYYDQFFIGILPYWRAMAGDRPLYGSDHPKRDHFRRISFNREYAQQLIDHWGHTLTITLVEDWAYTIYDHMAIRVGTMYDRPYKSLEKHVRQSFPRELVVEQGDLDANMFRYIEDAERVLEKLREHFFQAHSFLSKTTKETQSSLANILEDRCLNPEALILRDGLKEKKPRSKKVQSLADFLANNP